MLCMAQSRFTCLSLLVALGLAIGPGMAVAQTQQPTGHLGGAPSTQKAERMNIGILEGSVKAVDRDARTISVSSWPLGVFGKTLEVTNQTQIQVEGQQATLADIQEGAKVKASYETEEGKNVATEIEVMPSPK
jgi:Cu/Ag efflux protein CusF